MEQERLEGWIMTEVDRGVPLPGLYPPNEETRARYERARFDISEGLGSKRTARPARSTVTCAAVPSALPEKALQLRVFSDWGR